MCVNNVTNQCKSIKFGDLKLNKNKTYLTFPRLNSRFK